MITLQKQPIFLLNGEVIWHASDSPISKELHTITSNLIYLICHHSLTNYFDVVFNGTEAREYVGKLIPSSGRGGKTIICCRRNPMNVACK